MGLYIAHTIILRHEGEFEVTPNATDGTRISISLPQNASNILELRSDPANPDFSFVNQMSQEEFSILL